MGSQKFGDAGAQFPLDGAWLTTLKYTSTHMCCDTKLGHCMSNLLGIGRFNSELHYVHAHCHTTLIGGGYKIITYLEFKTRKFRINFMTFIGL